MCTIASSECLQQLLISPSLQNLGLAFLNKPSHRERRYRNFSYESSTLFFFFFCDSTVAFEIMVKKVIDSRIHTLVKNGVQNKHRSFFVIVGDKGKDQVCKAP